MGRKKLTASQLLAVALMMSIVPAIAAWFAYDFFIKRSIHDEAVEPWLRPAVTVTELPLPARSVQGELELYRFSPDLQAADIYSIVIDADALWLGTGKGLVHFQPGRRVRQHRQFSDAPYEWVRHLALNGHLLAADILVAGGNTGGEYAGNHLFDTRGASWSRLGGNVLDQVWLDGQLWQRRLDRTLTRAVQRADQWHLDEVHLQSRLCSEAYMAAIGNEIWIAQQGTVHSHRSIRKGGSHAKAVPCGVVRYNPATGEETFFDEGDGLNSGFGRDVAGDSRQIYVSHSIKHERISIRDNSTGRWYSARPYGSGNKIAISEAALWLATPSSRHPLVRIDRKTQKRKNIDGIPQGYYVGSLAVDGNVVWLGLYKKDWIGSTYSLHTLLARHEDNLPAY
jgi:hypothetical protein